jgi:hypothetical protein
MQRMLVKRISRGARRGQHQKIRCASIFEVAPYCERRIISFRLPMSPLSTNLILTGARPAARQRGAEMQRMLVKRISRGAGRGRRGAGGGAREAGRCAGGA